MARAEQAIPDEITDDFRLANLIATEHGRTIQMELEQHLHNALTSESLSMLEINRELVWYEASWKRVAAGR